MILMRLSACLTPRVLRMLPPVASISCTARRMGRRGSRRRASRIASSSSTPCPVGSTRSSGRSSGDDVHNMCAGMRSSGDRCAHKRRSVPCPRPRVPFPCKEEGAALHVVMAPARRGRTALTPLAGEKRMPADCVGGSIVFVSSRGYPSLIVLLCGRRRRRRRADGWEGTRSRGIDVDLATSDLAAFA